MSITYRSQPMISVITRSKQPKTLVPVPAFLNYFGLQQSESEKGQALRQCPDMVRVAIASHYMWWFLARAHSAVVRTFAHSFMGACRMQNASAMSQSYSAQVNNGLATPGIACVNRGYINAVHPVMAYRVLHYFCRYLQEGSAAGANANLMQKSAWVPYLRPGSPVGFEHRHHSQESEPGMVGTVPQRDYEDGYYQDNLVRSSASRWTAYKQGVITAMQPFFSVELVDEGTDITPFGECTLHRAMVVPQLLVKKPRSKRMVAMIPRVLAFGMEQVCEELPSAVHWVQTNDTYRQAVRRQINHYTNAREEAAMVAMSKRDSIVAWLAHYDTLAAIGYAQPQVAGCNVPMTESHVQFNAAKDVCIQFPGICENNLT
jgi:hypothetical protein